MKSVFLCVDIKAFEVKDTIGGDSNTERPSHNFAWVHRGNKTAGENFKYEFMGRRFNREILHVPVICSAYKEVVSLMEYYVFSVKLLFLNQNVKLQLIPV